jgi:long-chain fatty acid transport protein
MPQLASMRTTFQFMRIIPAVAYQLNEMITIGAALHGAWGSLNLGAQMCSFTNDADNDGVPGIASCWNAGGGQSQAIGVGAQVGVSLNFSDFLYGGFTYMSPVSMTYQRVFDSDNDGKFEDLKLTQPQEASLGLGAAPLNGLKFGVDVRWINWSGAEGYKQFQWKDQLVFSVGVEYKPTESLSLRVGYNTGKSPIEGGEKNGMNGNDIPDFKGQFSDYQIAWFNLAGFPAIAENHVTLGIGYDFSDAFGIELSYVRALDKKLSACMKGAFSGNFIETSMVQDSLSIGANWRF